MPIPINHQYDNQEQQHLYGEEDNFIQNGQQQNAERQYGYGYGDQQEESKQQRQLIMLETIKRQLVENNIITQQQLSNLLTDNHNNNSNQNNLNNNHYNSNNHTQQLYTLITHLTATLIQHNEHAQLQQQSHNSQILSLQSIIKNNQQLININDHHIISALQLFYNLTQQLSSFSHFIYSPNDTQSSGIINKKQLLSNSKIPTQIYKHFRHVYEFTQQLSNIFNQYEFTQQQLIQRRNTIIEQQIKTMEELILIQNLQQEDQQYYDLNQQEYQPQQQYPSPYPNISQPQPQPLPYSHYSTTHPHPATLPIQTSNYILSLRQQITHLHQTLIKNDEEFTHQIQKYNTTIRELSQTIKVYQTQIAKMIHYQLKIEELEKNIIILREDKYKNQIVIDNMAKKIRNYEKDLKGTHAFISPQRQRLTCSPDTKFSLINSKQFLINSINMSNSLQQQHKQRYKQKQRQRVSQLLIGGTNRKL